MFLDGIIAAQKRGEAKGITSICSSHSWVLKAAMQRKPRNLLIEATCNQVNQFGGYTGMNPAKFADYVRGVAYATIVIHLRRSSLGATISVQVSGKVNLLN